MTCLVTKSVVFAFAVAFSVCRSEDIYFLLCEGQNMTVSCPNDTVIDVVSASYGYNESNTSARKKCDPLARPRLRESRRSSCHHPNSTAILSNKCDGRSECELSATNDDFEDPCPRTTKYLEVFYNCRSERPESQETMMPIVTHAGSSEAPAILETTAPLIHVSETQMMTTIASDLSSTTNWQGRTTDIYFLLCEGQNMTVSCLNDTVIDVVFASYGYNESNTSARKKCDPLARPRLRESRRSSCHHPNSTAILSNKCDGRSECELSATNDDFGDPCPRTTKYLEVFYSCRSERPESQETMMPIVTHAGSSEAPAILETTAPLIHVSETQMMTSIASDLSSTTNWQGRTTDIYFLLCEGQNMTVSCPNDTVIDVVSASYGYNESNTSARKKCDPLARPRLRESRRSSCHHPNSTAILSNKCDGRSECELSATNDDFEDPCPRTTKYLEVFYSCRSERPESQETMMPIVTHAGSSEAPAILETTAPLIHVSETQMMTTIASDVSSTTNWQGRTTERPESQETMMPIVTHVGSSEAPAILETTVPLIHVSETQMLTTIASDVSSSTNWQGRTTASTIQKTTTSIEVSETTLSTASTRDRLTTTTWLRQITDRVTSTPFISRNHSETLSKDKVTVTDIAEAGIRTTVLDRSSTTTFPERLSEVLNSTPLITQNDFETLSSSAVMVKNETQAEMNTFILDSSTTTTFPEPLSEVVSTTSDITRNHSKTTGISKNTTTVKDVTEAEISATISGISATTTVPEVYLLLCESKKKTIDCPNNAIIEIVSASYGYNGSSTSAREKCDPLAWFWELGNDDTRCHARRSTEILTTKCGESLECEVFASNEVFGDPCQGTRKFLEVFYYCRAERPKILETTMPNVAHDDSSVVSKVMRTTTASIDVSETQMRTTTSSKVSSSLPWQDEHTEHPEIQETTTVAHVGSSVAPQVQRTITSSTDPSKSQTTTSSSSDGSSKTTWQSENTDIHLFWCEHDTETLSCPNNSVIVVKSASYGYNGNNTTARQQCDSFWTRFLGGNDNVECHHPNSTDILKDLCDRRSECEVFASNDIFGDPCEGVKKYLEIIYSCMFESLNEHITITPNVPRSSASAPTTSTVVSINVTGSANTTAMAEDSSETTTVRDISSSNDVTDAQLITIKPRTRPNESDGEEVAKSSLLPVIIAVVCAICFAVVVGVVRGFVLWRRTRTSKLQLEQVRSISPSNEYSMKSLDSTYTSSGGNDKEQATKTMAA